MTSANHPMAWADLAACTDLDPALFYIERGHAIDPDVVAACKRCPVRGACTDWSLRHEWYGYWAGMSGRQRRALRRTLNITFVEPEPVTEVAITAAPEPLADLDIERSAAQVAELAGVSKRTVQRHRAARRETA